MAATLCGAEYVTTDLDIAPDTTGENLERLSAALDDLDARVRTGADPDGLPFPHDGASLLRARLWNLVTRAGHLDVAFSPSGTGGYADLRRRDALVVEIDGVEVMLASLADVVRSKAAAGRDKDMAARPMLRRLLDGHDG